MPSAQVWRAVAEVLTQGLDFLHPTAQAAIVLGAILGIVFEAMNRRMRGRFPLSGVGMGLAFVLPFLDSLAMAVGAVVFRLLRHGLRDPSSTGYRAFVDNRETLCAGAIAGGALVGIALILFEAAAP